MIRSLSKDLSIYPAQISVIIKVKEVMIWKIIVIQWD